MLHSFPLGTFAHRLGAKDDPDNSFAAVKVDCHQINEFHRNALQYVFQQIVMCRLHPCDGDTKEPPSMLFSLPFVGKPAESQPTILPHTQRIHHK